MPESNFETQCVQMIDKFCKEFPEHSMLSDRAKQIARMLAASGEPLRGDPAGWIGGIIHAMTHRGCGVPGILNADIEECFGVTMGTIRKRSWRVLEVVRV